MMNKKILYVDMDGVLADFEATLHRVFPQVLEVENGSEAANAMVDDFCMRVMPGIFGELALMKHAVEAVTILSREYEVYFLSSPMWGVPQSYADKRVWIERFFGEMARKRLILTHNKGLNAGDYLVDDRVKNGVANFKGEHIHFGQEKFREWVDVLNYLSFKDGWEFDRDELDRSV